MAAEYSDAAKIAGRMLGCEPEDLPADLQLRIDRLCELVGEPFSIFTTQPVVAAMIEQWEREHEPIPVGADGQPERRQ